MNKKAQWEFGLPKVSTRSLKPDKKLQVALGMRKADAREPVPADIKKKVRARAKNTCEYPHCPYKENLEFHHKNMKRNDQRVSNIVLLCPNHHKKRHGEKIRKVVYEDKVLGIKKTRLCKKGKRKNIRRKTSYNPFELKLPKLKI